MSYEETAKVLAVLDTLNDNGPLPELIVFDLDYTLWSCWVDTHPNPPLKGVPSGEFVRDRSGQKFKFYKHVPTILVELQKSGIKIAAASRTQTPDLAKQMLLYLKVTNDEGLRTKSIDLFDDLQIFPGNKVKHFRNIKEALSIDFEDMIFFDDEMGNRNVEKELGVMFAWVKDGVNPTAVDEAIREWRKRKSETI